MKCIQSQRFLKTKDSEVFFFFFFCRWTNIIQGSTMQPLKTSKSFELTWPLRKQPSNLWMLLVRLQKNLTIFCFQKRCDWIIFFWASWFACPHCKHFLHKAGKSKLHEGFFPWRHWSTMSSWLRTNYVSPASQPVSRAGWLALLRLQHLNAPKLINSVITWRSSQPD